MGTRVRLLLVPITGVVLLTGGCTGDDERAGARSSDERSPAESIVRSAQEIELDGRSIHFECWGEPVTDEPTMLLLSGAELTTDSWEVMAGGFAEDGHHLCSYDRSGVGRSEPAPPARRTTVDQVDELLALLDRVDLQEPLIVVAHSMGSFPAVGLAARAPERVAGVVLVDPATPRVDQAQLDALPPERPDESPELAEERRWLTEFLSDPSQNPESLHLATCDEEVAALLDAPGPIFGDLPVIVLEAPLPERPPGLPGAYHRATVTAWQAGHAELAGESRRGRVVRVDDTGHMIQDDRPDAVMNAIREVLAG